jgi:hypothetical protein
MADDLLTLAEAREEFAKTEPLASVSFGTDPEYSATERQVAIFGEKWVASAARGADDKFIQTEPVQAWLEVPALEGQRFQLTFQAARELGSTCRIPQDLQVSIPSEQQQGLVNWFLAEGLGIRRLKLLLAGTGEDEHGDPVPLVVAQTRDTVQPFSNLALLDQVLAVVADKFGPQAAARAMVHFTMYHDLERTNFAVVVPEASRAVAGDDWAPGIEVTNSCIGLKQTTVTGLALREESSAVVLDAAHSAGGFRRLKSTPEQAYEWTGEASQDVLRAMDVTWANVAELATMATGDHVNTFVESLCAEFRIPNNLVEKVTTVLEEYPGELTMYTLATMFARVANMDELSWRAVEQLTTMAGHLVHSLGARCTAGRPCYRALPPGFEVPS